MKQLLTLTAATVLLAGTSFAQPAPAGPHGHGAHHNPLQEMTSSLHLTPDQQAKVQPIIDQARPQFQAIHQEAMTKAQGVVDASLAQIRPLLTPEQQTKLDAEMKAHQDMVNAMKEMRDARGE